jgi:hypothetical protein
MEHSGGTGLATLKAVGDWRHFVKKYYQLNILKFY